jgi:hypothetical protein
VVITDLARRAGRWGGARGHADRAGFYRTDIRFWLAEAGFSNVIVSPIHPGTWAGGQEDRHIRSAGLFMATATI